MYSAIALYKCLGVLLFLDITLLQSYVGSALKISPPPHDPKKDVEIVNPEDLDEESPVRLPNIESVRVDTNISFRYAKTRVVTRIKNYDGKNAHPVNFTLTIPTEAFITNLEMRVDGHIYEANITSNDAAKEIFEFSEKEGRSVTAGILEQGKRATSFLIKFIIAAKKTVRFRLTYEELLVRNDDQYEFTFNLKAEQAYMFVQSYRIKVTIDESQPIKVGIPPLHKEFASAMERQPQVDQISPSKAEINWTWNNSFVEDFIFVEKQFEDVFTIQYSLENETTSGEILIRNGYFVHFFAPVGMIPLTKHVVFVLDSSDSMMGHKREQLELAMLEILDDLKAEDFFNIISFSSDTQLWYHFHSPKSKKLYPYPATKEYKDSADYFIKNKLYPHGSTNIFAALEQAIEVCQNVSSTRRTYSDETIIRGSVVKKQERLNETLPENVESIIIFLTDGEPTSGIIDHKELLQRIKVMNADPFVPIYTLAFGDGADYNFLKEISSQNGAFSRKIFADANASLQVAEFYNEISMPVMSNVTFKYTSSNPKFSYEINVTSTDHLIFKGREVIYAGQFKNYQESNDTFLHASIEGKSHLGRVSYSPVIKAVCVPSKGYGSCNDDEESIDELFIKRLMVYLTIKKLVMKDLTEPPGGEYDDLHVEDCRKLFENADELNDYMDDFRKPCEYIQTRQKIIDAAVEEFTVPCACACTRNMHMHKKYKFVTPFTSLIMRTKSIGEEEKGNVGNIQNHNDWEWFLGSEIPAPKSMKISAVDVNPNEQEITAIIPKPQALQMEKSFNDSTNQNYTSTTPSPSKVQGNRTKTNLNDALKVALSLLKIHQMLRENSTASNNVTTWKRNLTLSDVKWLGTSDILNIPTLNENNQTVPTYYRILRDAESEFDSNLASSFQLCPSSPELLIECRHLKDCVVEEFLTDFELFKTSYMCPKIIGNERFLGSCCLLY